MHSNYIVSLEPEHNSVKGCSGIYSVCKLINEDGSFSHVNSFSKGVIC